MNIWKSYMWTMERRIIWRTIIAVTYATYAGFLFAAIHNSNIILIRKDEEDKINRLKHHHPMIDDHLNWHKILNLCQHDNTSFLKTLPGGGGGNPMSPIWILKRLVSVFINACCLNYCHNLAEGGCLLSCLSHNFILRALATFWAMSLVRIYPGRASWLVQAGSEPTSSSSIDRGSPN